MCRRKYRLWSNEKSEIVLIFVLLFAIFFLLTHHTIIAFQLNNLTIDLILTQSSNTACVLVFISIFLLELIQFSSVYGLFRL